MKKIIALISIVLIFPIIVLANENFVPYDIIISNELGTIAFDENNEQTIIKYEEVLKVINKKIINEKEYLEVQDINNKVYYIHESDTNLLNDPTDPTNSDSKNDISVDLAEKETTKENGKTISSGNMQDTGEMNTIETVFAILAGGVTLSFVLIAIKNRIVLKEQKAESQTQ